MGSATCAEWRTKLALADRYLGIEEPLACSYEDAALNHLRDGLGATAEQRWNWLREAMQFAIQTARQRAARGEVTLGPDGSVWWSPEQERAWNEAGGVSAP